MRQLRFFKSSSIRSQLILWNIAALSILLLALGFVIQYTVLSTMMSSVDRDLLEQAHRMAGPPGHRGPGPDGSGPDGPPPDGFGPPEMGGYRDDSVQQRQPNDRPPPRHYDPYPAARIRFDGGSGNSRMRQLPWDDDALVKAKTGVTVYSTIVEEGEPLRLVSFPYPDQGPLRGVVQSVYPLTDVYRAIEGLNRALLLLSAPALLCAGLVGAFLTDRVLRRVRLMTQAAGKIGAEDLGQRLPVVGEDEFSELAGTFNALLGRLESAFRAQSRLIEQQRRFTADASHELKTPLTIIKGTATLALIASSSEAQNRQSFAEIDRAASQMSHLVRDLLILARADSGQLGADRIELLLRDVLRQAISHIAAPPESRPPITLTQSDEALTVSGNEGELVRLFRILLDNSVRYTPIDSAGITIGAWKHGTRVIVDVVDSGSGIPTEHLAHLGERFYRVDASRSRPDGGTGLGLSIAKSIVEAHDGSLRFESIVGKGTTVHIALPAGDNIPS